MIWDPINLTNILGAIAWPLFGWLAVKAVCAAVTKSGEQDVEKLRLHQQHEVVKGVQEELKQ
jgi:DNA-binding transcriptional regulator of glucitol operon